MDSEVIGGISGSKNPWDTTDTEDREIVWTNVGKATRIVYLVVDEGAVYKEYLDRFFIFTDPLEAIEKIRTLCRPKGELELPELKTQYGGIALTDFTPDFLKPGIRHVFKYENTQVYIIAVSVTGAS